VPARGRASDPAAQARLINSDRQRAARSFWRARARWSSLGAKDYAGDFGERFRSTPGATASAIRMPGTPERRARLRSATWSFGRAFTDLGAPCAGPNARLRFLPDARRLTCAHFQPTISTQPPHENLTRSIFHYSRHCCPLPRRSRPRHLGQRCLHGIRRNAQAGAMGPQRALRLDGV
jgi:hypothetical protein